VLVTIIIVPLEHIGRRLCRLDQRRTDRAEALEGSCQVPLELLRRPPSDLGKMCARPGLASYRSSIWLMVAHTGPASKQAVLWGTQVLWRGTQVLWRGTRVLWRGIQVVRRGTRLRA
jgi:hypothetical protein